MSSAFKHRERSHRNHRRYIPRFQQYMSVEVRKQQFKRDKTSFAEHMATLFMSLRKFVKR